MGRIRTVKPEFFTDEELSLLPEITHLFAAGLLCYADDEGYFNANPGLIKAAIYPLRESSVNVQVMLMQLSEMGYVQLGNTAEGKFYGKVVNFLTHQRVSHPSPSKIKGLPITWEGSANPPEDSVKAPEVLRPEGKGKELGTGKGIEGEAPRETLDHFEGMELQIANDLFQEFRIPSDAALTRIAGQALVFECDRLGSPEKSLDGMRAAMKQARARGDTINRFWFQDQRYAKEEANGHDGKAGSNGSSKPSATRERVVTNLEALHAATLKRGDGAAGGSGARDDPTQAERGSEYGDRTIPGGFRSAGPEVLPPERGGGAGSPAHKP